MTDKDDGIDHPKHYTFGSIEVIDALEAWGLDFRKSCVIKYIARAGRKGDRADELRDLKKARWYINRLISELERGP